MSFIISPLPGHAEMCVVPEMDAVIQNAVAHLAVEKNLDVALPAERTAFADLVDTLADSAAVAAVFGVVVAAAVELVVVEFGVVAAAAVVAAVVPASIAFDDVVGRPVVEG